MLPPFYVAFFVAALTLADSNNPSQVWKEADLRPHRGIDSDSILIALNGTVYDVSGSPRFYGPGGPYHHFTGRDASRAWVTECWDDEDQLTWKMNGVQDMFMPRYLDEFMKDVADGTSGESFEGLGDLGVGKEQLESMAKLTVDKFGGVGKKEKARRREEDGPEAEKKVEDALKHWVDFFEGKYAVVGTVEYDESTPGPPALCEAAMKKRPVKGGKLESFLGQMKGMMGQATGGDDAGARMPDFVKERLKQKEAAGGSASGEQEEERDEL